MEQYTRESGFTNNSLVTVCNRTFKIFHKHGNGGRCVNFTTCPASYILHDGVYIMQSEHDSSCRTGRLEIINMRLMAALRLACVHEAGTIRTIYDKTITRFPGHSVTFDSYHRTMSRQRNGYSPTLPTTFEELDALMRDYPRLSMVKDGSQLLYSGLVTSKDRNPQKAAIFLSPAVLHYFNQCLEMGMDGTFKSRPSHPTGIKQVIVITIFVFKRAFVLATVLCSGKRETLYREILKHIKLKASEIEDTVLMVPKTMHCDFERGMMNALAEVITGTVLGCYSHHCQALQSRLSDVCLLGSEYHSVPLVKKVMKLLVSLPYLEPEMVPRGFELIEGYLTSQMHLVSERVQRQLNSLLVYYKTTWLDMYGPKLFCIGGNAITSNNDLESINHTLNVKFGLRPGLISWIESNMIFENATATELKEAAGGNRTRRVLSEKQRDSKAKLVRINILRTDLSEETISLEYFLDSISKFYLADGEHAEVLALYNASLPATVFPLSRGVINAGQQVFQNATARPAAVNHNIPLLIPIEVAVNDALNRTIEIGDPIDAEYPLDGILVEDANMVQPILPSMNERQRIAEACREAAQARMRAVREMEMDLATQRRIPAIRVLAAGNAIDYGQPFFPVQDNVLFQENLIAPRRIVDGGATLMPVDENENAVALRNDERYVVPQIRIVARAAVPGPRDRAQPLIAVQANVPLQQNQIAPRRIIDGGAAMMPVNGNENAVALRNDERYAAPEIRNAARVAVRGRRDRAIAPGQPLIAVQANVPLEENPIAPRRIVYGGAVQRNVAEGGAIPRRRGRPPGTTALVMAARRAGIPLPNIPPNAPHLPQVVRLPPQDGLPVYVPMDEGPDENRWFNHDHIRAIINNRAARAAAENNVAVLAPEEQEDDTPEDIPEEDEEIMANVSCCICQTRRSNLSSKCGHLYCSNCYSIYWKQKRANWNRVLFGAFQQKKVACATCRKELGKMRKIHLNGV